MADKISTLDQVAAVLDKQGYKTRLLPDEAVMLDIGGAESPFVAVVTMDEGVSQFIVTCQLAELGDLDEEKSPQFMMAALDANTVVRPYAFAVISDSDDPALQAPEKWPVVLTSSLPIGDLSESELSQSMDELWLALTAAGPVLKLGLSE